MLTSRHCVLESALLACVLGSMVACSSDASAPPDNSTGNAGSGGSASGSGGTSGSGGSSGTTGGSGGSTGGTGGSTGGIGGSTGGIGGSTGATGGVITGGTGGSGGVQTGGVSGTGGSATFDAGSDPNRNNVQAGAVCDRLATVQCAAEQYCCASAGRTFDQCKAAQMTECGNLYLDEVTLNSVSGFDATAAATAFTQYENLASMCDTTIVSWGISTDGLRGITKGTIDPGGACTPSNKLDNANVAAYLVSCKDAATTACLPSTTGIGTWTCTARAAAGGRCFTDLNCQDGLYCDNPNLANFDSQCQTRKADGQTCATGNECASLACVGGMCVAADQQAVYCLQ